MKRSVITMQNMTINSKEIFAWFIFSTILQFPDFMEVFLENVRTWMALVTVSKNSEFSLNGNNFPRLQDL